MKKKTRQTISVVIAGVLVLSMIAGLIASFI